VYVTHVRKCIDQFEDQSSPLDLCMLNAACLLDISATNIAEL